MNASLLVVIVGPTGSGKSELGIELALTYEGEVVNCDSMQLYRGMDIGTGKLTRDDRRQVPHHLLDILDPSEAFSAGEYARRARRVLEEIRRRDRLPIVVGGTGLYLRALLEGLFEGPRRSPEIRRRLNVLIGKGQLPRLYRWLCKVDPEAEGRIMPRDRPRVVRALEVYLLTGRAISEHFRQGHRRLEGFRILKIGLNPARPEVYDRIHRRIDRMLAAGWIDEVRGLLHRRCAPTDQAFSALGYRRIVEYLEGKIDRQGLVGLIQTDTRHYAKRQWTWFRRDKEVRWLDGFGDQAPIQRQAAEWVKNGL